jgi:hypothetical protein
MADDFALNVRIALDRAYDRAILVVVPPLAKGEARAVERVKDARAEAEENVREDAERRAAAKTKWILEEALSSLGRMG